METLLKPFADIAAEAVGPLLSVIIMVGVVVWRVATAAQKTSSTVGGAIKKMSDTQAHHTEALDAQTAVLRAMSERLEGIERDMAILKDRGQR